MGHCALGIGSSVKIAPVVRYTEIRLQPETKQIGFNKNLTKSGQLTADTWHNTGAGRKVAVLGRRLVVGGQRRSRAGHVVGGRGRGVRCVQRSVLGYGGGGQGPRVGTSAVAAAAAALQEIKLAFDICTRAGRLTQLSRQRDNIVWPKNVAFSLNRLPRIRRSKICRISRKPYLVVALTLISS